MASKYAVATLRLSSPPPIHTFHPPPFQFDADTLGCSVDSRGENGLVIDSYNPGSPARTNTLDPSASGTSVRYH